MSDHYVLSLAVQPIFHPFVQSMSSQFGYKDAIGDRVKSLYIHLSTQPVLSSQKAIRSVDGKVVNLESTVGFEIDIKMFISAKLLILKSGFPQASLEKN
ncbi:hypothetical protein llap_6852 [Limosa lapponica baueri]|uniref:Uncharacterized protein n=1 Tax=Limosa lapponica baueri TaxID=1758121 RepID=A0A2I0UA09_LIMLA|nr:hypothetical protein llap_6852 [Limosa lapponica baueri]